MAETPKNDTRSSRKAAAKGDTDFLFPVNFAEASLRGTSLMAQTNNILLQAAHQIWEKEAELFQPAHFLKPVNANGSGMHGFLDQWHENAERTVGQVRAIQDLMRDCEWRLFALAAETMSAPNQRAAE